ncbi:hypothetical protein H5410_030678, partial [Solanum commersonii]
FVQFSIPPPEESLSTPVCGIGETVESITPPTEVVAYPLLNFGEILPCSPILVLSGKESQNFESQSVVKPSLETPSEELEVISRVVSSTMSKRLFERDLPEGKELVAAQILASLRRDFQPTLVDQELISPEQVPHSSQPLFDQTPKSFDVDSEEKEEEETHLVWHRKGVRGANALSMGVSDMGVVDVIPETKLAMNPLSLRGKEKEKEKARWWTHTKGDKRRYAIRGKVQKLLGDAMVPTLEPHKIDSNETVSKDVTREVAKRRKEVEVERVKTKRVPKSMKKSLVKRDKVTKRGPLKPKHLKGPGLSIETPIEEIGLTKEERIARMEKQKVLNGRVFDPEILTEFGMSTLFDCVSFQSWEHLFEAPAPYLHELEVQEFYYKMELLSDGDIQTTVIEVKIFLNEENLDIILGVPVTGIRSIEGCQPS